MENQEMNSQSKSLYKPDILGEGFEQICIEQPDDYEGKVIFTLVRKKTKVKTEKAILYIHGFNDYFFQSEFAEKFAALGYDFYGIDLRKYGRAYLKNQKFNNLRSIEEYYSDIDKSLELIRNEGHSKVLLGGHSNGGLIVSVYAADHPDSQLFHAVFMNSPFFDFHQNYFLRKLGVPLITALGKKFPNAIMQGGFSPFYGLSLHKSEHGEWDYSLEYKPHISPPVNFGFIRAISLSQKRVKNGLSIQQPVLIMLSDKTLYEKKWSDKMFTGDVILNVEHIMLNAKKFKGDIQIEVIKNGIHDLVLSTKSIREEVYHKLQTWLEQKGI